MYWGIPPCHCSGQQNSIGRGEDCVNLYEMRLWCYVPKGSQCKDAKFDTSEQKWWSSDVCNDKYRGTFDSYF